MDSVYCSILMYDSLNKKPLENIMIGTLIQKWQDYIPYEQVPKVTSIGLLVLRIWVGATMALAHGLPKLQNFSVYVEKFADPFGFGAGFTLLVAVFAEFFCMILLILGLATRLATIAPIVTMATAILIIHAQDPWSKQEFGMLYLIPFVVLAITGPGRYSIDHGIRRKLEEA